MSFFFRMRNSFSPSILFLAALALGVAASGTLSGAEPIHDAARKGDVKKLKSLLQGDPKLVSLKDNNGDTPLHLAALHGQLEAVHDQAALPHSRQLLHPSAHPTQRFKLCLD